MAEKFIHTPWGHSQHQEEIAPGIVMHHTASHGGIRLSPERQRQLAEKTNYLVQPDTSFLNTMQWWEEDCDWAIPYYFLADEIKAACPAHKNHVEWVSWVDGAVEHAKESILHWHPELAHLLD